MCIFHLLVQITSDVAQGLKIKDQEEYARYCIPKERDIKLWRIY